MEPVAVDVTTAARRTRRHLGTGLSVALALMVLVGRPMISGAFGAGDYTFMHETGGEPVTWDRCKAIDYQVNPKGAPADWQRIVHAAVDEVEAASGFVFADRGTTVKRDLLLQGRYDGNEWEPVLITWSDRYQDRLLDGDTIGFGGSAPIEVGGRLRYVVGRVALDSAVTDSHQAQMVLEHELGHVLGLGHAKHRSELMYPGYSDQDGFTKSDVAGLQRLHDVPCG